MYSKIKKDRFLLIILFASQMIISAVILILLILLKDKSSFFRDYGLYFLVTFLFLANIGDFFFISRLIQKTHHYLSRTDITVSSIFGNEVSPVFNFGDIVIMVYNEFDEIIWISKTGLIKQDELLGRKTYDIIPRFDEIAIMENSNEMYTELDGKTFKIQINTGLKSIFLQDVSVSVIQSEKIEAERPFIGHIVIDNYQDIIVSYGENDFATFSSAIKNAIIDWAKNEKIFIRSYGTDSYLIIGEESTYQQIAMKNFSIMDQIRQLSKKDDNPLTISIGIGRGNTTSLLRTSELSYTALNIALSRGGDQVVVNTFGKPYEYYGAKNEVKQTRSHVRGRVLAASLANHIKNHKNIFIMGHKNMDFDALGASLGILSICKAYKAKAHFVYEDELIEQQTKRTFRELFNQSEINEMTLTPAKALAAANEESLVIVVDTHRPQSTMQPKLLEKCKDICVIDHHRKGENFIENPLFQYHEPQSSSASELVTELIFYQEAKVQVSEKIANFLLAGICLDTKFFKTASSSKTFEMAMILKGYQASVELVNGFFKEEYNELKLTSSIVSTMTSISRGIFVATNDDSDIITRTALSKVAEQILDTKDVTAVFVIGRTNSDEVSVSARSTTDFNVQIIMEKLNGGGHFTKAATQMKNVDVNYVKSLVEEKVKIYQRDGKL